MTGLKAVILVQQSLRGRDDLRKAKYQGKPGLTGHCYVASEALYHLLGGRESGWVPTFIRHEGEPHWYLRRGQQVLDPTASQFKTMPNYAMGIGKGFLTRLPSKRAKIVLDAIRGAS